MKTLATLSLNEWEMLEKYLNESAVVALAGENFSGRTELLRRATGLSLTQEASENDIALYKFSVYIGPDVYNDISALGSTVEEELKLHCTDSLEEPHVAEVIKNLKLTSLFKRNPFLLSGGEQALLVIASKISLMPDLLAVDCALEQVDTSHKKILLKWLANGHKRNLKTIIADNFLEDITNGNPDIKVLIVQGKKNDLFESINSDEALFRAIGESPCLMLDGITFRYETWTERIFHKLARTIGRNIYDSADIGNILGNLSTELKPGQLYFLEGHNGAGKSTLAKILCGVLRPISGQIFLNGKVAKPWKQPGQTVGYHFQNPDVQLFTESVKDEILARLKTDEIMLSERERRYNSIISAFGLTKLQEYHPLDLPFVIRKRIALACTIAMGRSWVILDEPTLGQDLAASEAIARIIEQLISLNTGVIVISHSSWLRSRLSPSANFLQLKNGKLHKPLAYEEERQGN